MNKKNALTEAEKFEQLYASAKDLKVRQQEELASRLLSTKTKESLADRSWLKETRDKLGLDICSTIYVQDPLVAEFNPALGLQDVSVHWEPGLFDGPTSSKVAVVDYDGDKDSVYKPAVWDSEKWAFVAPNGHSLDKDNSDNFHFHQVNLWATIMKVIEFYEEPDALGRKVSWAFNGNRLIVVPHAGYGKNAFYDRGSKSLQFYYCGSEKQPVFTCLSHDIIAHETGHAILDGIRPYFNELSSFQTAAFHEFVADMTAVLTAFRNNDVRKVLKEATKGQLTKDRFISGVGEQFAKHVQNREFLRTARNPHNMDKVNMSNSPHFNSQVLTGAMFDIMTRMAANYMEERDKKPGAALWYTIGRFRRVALQALDYCPPVDIRFEDYANAVLRRDQLANPDDPHRYREIMRGVFDCRKILHSIEEAEPDYSKFYCPNIGYVSDSAVSVYHMLHEWREDLFIPAHQDICVLPPYKANKVRRLYQRRPTEIVLQYVWQENVELKGTKYGSLQGRSVPFLCGGTLVYDENGNLLHWCRKPGMQFRFKKRYKRNREKEEKELEDGIKRQKDLLDFIAFFVNKKSVRLRVGERGAMDIWTPIDVFETDEGLKLVIAPRLHHGSEI
jgi:hypothetical protein